MGIRYTEAQFWYTCHLGSNQVFWTTNQLSYMFADWGFEDMQPAIEIMEQFIEG